MDILRKNEQSQFIAQDKAIVKEIASPRNSNITNLSLAEVMIRPGDSVLAHYHVESEELFYVLRGVGTMTVDVESCSIGEGDAVVVPPGSTHCVRNDGKSDLIMLVICSQYYRDEDQMIVD